MSKRENAQTRLAAMSDAELDFLHAQAWSNPGTWKGNIRLAWACSSNNCPESQAIRNRIGPSGLNSLTRDAINNEWQNRRRAKGREATNV